MLSPPDRGLRFHSGLTTPPDHSYIGFIENAKGPVKMLTVHHLGISQSERIVWLCEELGIPYKLVKHKRDPMLSPPSLEKVPGNETGKSPFMDDADKGVQLNESAAICEYIINEYGNGRFAIKHGEPHYADYLYWFHYSNGTLQPAMIDQQMMDAADVSADNQIMGFVKQRLEAAFKLLDKRLSSNKYLAGPELTAADIMSVYSLTTQRYWGAQADLGSYPNILRWLKDCSEREGYKRAMEKGDPDMQLLLGPDPPKMSMLNAGGTKSDHWKKKARA